MPLTLSEVTSDSEWPAIIDCERTSYETPFNSFFIILCPTGKGAHGRAESLTECTERQRDWHKGDPDSHWLKVTDSETGQVAGAAQWKIFKDDPHSRPDQKPMTAYWYPEGEQRDLVDELAEQWFGPRKVKMRRPHLMLENCFVHPSHRRRGVGSLLVNWGVQIADQIGLEAFIEASEDGKPMYERHGFVAMNDFHPTTPMRSDGSEEYKELYERLRLPAHGYLMWRPPGGKFEKGKTVVPWEESGRVEAYRDGL